MSKVSAGAEAQHVAVAHRVVAALQGGLRLRAAGEFAPGGDFGAHEAVLKIGVHAAGGVVGGGAVGDQPGSRLGGARGKEGVEVEEGAERLHEALEGFVR